MGKNKQSEMFLNSSQLEELTDYKRHCDQVRWLKGKYAFEISRKGMPKVLKSAVDAKLGTTLNSTNDEPQLHL